MTTLSDPAAKADAFCEVANRCYLGDGSPIDAIRWLVAAFYRMGVIGLRGGFGAGWQWSYEGAPIIEESQITADTELKIHFTFLISLGAIRMSGAKDRQRTS
jgi:hypothetical protein